tara:strand:+ start:65 stop:247 length:183 start_codon:yes stop_codon:yes gene_type:complete
MSKTYDVFTGKPVKKKDPFIKALENITPSTEVNEPPSKIERKINKIIKKTQKKVRKQLGK